MDGRRRDSNRRKRRERRLIFIRAIRVIRGERVRTVGRKKAQEAQEDGGRGTETESEFCHRDHRARTQRRKEMSRRSHRADPSLGSTSVCLLCHRSEKCSSQETNRVKTEQIPPSDRPRYASCATDWRRLFHRSRTVPSRSGVHGTQGIHGRIFTGGNGENGG